MYSNFILLPEFTTLVYSGFNGNCATADVCACVHVCSRFKPICMTADILSTVCEPVREMFCATTCLRVTSLLVDSRQLPLPDSDVSPDPLRMGERSREQRTFSSR